MIDVERYMAEIYAGIRTEFSTSNFRPYLGGGGVLLSVTERRGQFFGTRDDDGAAGGYVHGGIEYDLNEIFFLGVDFRQVFATDVELFGEDFDTDYRQLALTLGISF